MPEFNEVIKPPSTTIIRIPILRCFGTKILVKCNGSVLKQDKATFNHGKIVNVYTVYKCSSNTKDFDFALENCLVRAVKITKNANIDKC